jgi:hypothetical protein
MSAHHAPGAHRRPLAYVQRPPAAINVFDLDRLADPMLALKGLRGLVILDEIQRRPDLNRALWVLAERPDHL